MTVGYVIKRVGVFLLIIWITATINFIIPRLAPGDPVQAVLGGSNRRGPRSRTARC